MSDDSFLIETDSEIYLYGNNARAQRVYINLNQAGIYIQGIIDRKYKTVEYINDIVYANIEYLAGKQECVVIICLQNALEHEVAVQALLKLGLNRIIYLPMAMNRPLCELHVLRRAYRLIMEGDLNYHCQIPVTKSGYEKRCCYEIEKDNKGITFYCSVDKLYTIKEVDIQSGNIKNEHQIQLFRPYADKKICYCEPYFQLFKYLESGVGYPDRYLMMQREREDDQKNLLINRMKLYQVYELNFKYNFDFFFDSPIEVKWNKKGYFNILDGAHRVVYLMTKHLDYVPVRASASDYDQYREVIQYDINTRMV